MLHRPILVISSLFLMFSHNVLAKTNTTVTPTPPAAASTTSANSPTTVSPKHAWITTLRNELPSRLCDPTQYFVRCYKVSESECKEMMTTIVDSCVDNAIIGLPENFTPQDSELWSKMVGRCSLDLYEKYMKTKTLDRPECHVLPSKQNIKTKKPAKKEK